MTLTFGSKGAGMGLPAAAALAVMLMLGTGSGAMAQAAGPSTTPPPAAAPQAATPQPAPPADGPYVFSAPPSAQANRVYSVNVRNGEVNACQFERPEGSVVGITKCFPRDSSANAGGTGDYDIVSTRYSGETGIFRVNTQTGQMSVCYVRDMPKEGGGVEPSVVCTALAR